MEYAIWVRKLRAYRERKGLLQRDFAAMVGVGRVQYTQIEKGSSIINFTQLHNLAKGLNLKLETLVTLPSVTQEMVDDSVTRQKEDIPRVEKIRKTLQTNSVKQNKC
ncbi:MAG: hypothetical protein CMK74_02210 [Pseudomonadales bacterium]|nr:hypothetical protein [Pseudomonadales bacterium]|tara:strand:+ start:247 stop:567 length:321 start_codon:yes stop_codon:yes gene_type:complete